MGQKIKSIRKKINNNQFDYPIALGADGKNVDMKSGLSLEQEIRLGCLADTEIIQHDDGSYEIITVYLDKNKNPIYWQETFISEEEKEQNNDKINTTIIQTHLFDQHTEIEKETLISSTASAPNNISITEEWIQ